LSELRSQDKKKSVLSDMAAKEKKQREDAISKVWDCMFESFHKKEQGELDFTNRPFAWQSHHRYQWVCQYQSAEGRVCVGKSKLLWWARVTRPKHSGKSHYFVKLMEPIEWTEKEIVELVNQPEVPEPPPHLLPEEHMEAARVRLRKKLLGTPF
jgi:hypothetical protein